VRFTTAAALVNELLEAKQQLELLFALAAGALRRTAIDNVGCVPSPRSVLSSCSGSLAIAPDVPQCK